MLDWLSGIAQGIGNLAENIASGIAGLFIPSPTYFADKVVLVTDNFAFVTSIIDTVNMLSDFFSDVSSGEVPKIEINLSLAESKYNYGSAAYALDMSWYSRYKPTVDKLLSAMLWLFFLWRMFCALPGIISGTAASFQAEERYTKIMDKRSKKP